MTSLLHGPFVGGTTIDLRVYTIYILLVHIRFNGSARFKLGQLAIPCETVLKWLQGDFFDSSRIGSSLINDSTNAPGIFQDLKMFKVVRAEAIALIGCYLGSC